MNNVEPWLSVWAKTDRDPNDRAVVTGWLPLPQHLADAAAVAGLLIDHWVSPQVLVRLGRDLGGEVKDVKSLVMWLAAVHDVGKASPAFAVQALDGAPVLLDRMRQHELTTSPLLALDPDRSRIRHEFVGQLAVRTWLTGELGFTKRGTAQQLASIVGSHHGVPPAPTDLGAVKDRPHLAGTGEWEQARHAILRWATDLLGVEDVLRRHAEARLGRPAQALLTAVVIMADWIASNDDYFPLDPLHTADAPPQRPDPVLTAARAQRGWADLDLPPRWAPEPIGDVRAAFAARFDREPGSARPVQIAAVEAARAMEQPGLVIVEAPMGEGKTEAAFLAVEVLAARSGADGCFVALPTRATSDAMFTRALSWMRRLPGLPAGTSVTLAHGTASLNDDYAGLVRHGNVRGVAEDAGRVDARHFWQRGREDGAAVAHVWLRGRKKGALAQFVIGTVDQVLFAGLKSRHLMLRHLALAGKVVVIDEVHAYDVYMSQYLDRVLHWLGAYGTPVVLLSATLPAGRRAELMHSYETGRGAEPAPPVGDPGYPVVLASGLPPRPVAASRPPLRVQLERLPDDLEPLVALLRDRLADGGCAVVVRNTVRRVQDTADALIEEFGADRVTVNHSRYLACDRARTDKELLRLFGPPGQETRRPPLHVVVASQVVEQSLDVDFDLMVTDLAPVDLVLQRLGRLHRHDRPRPARVTAARCVLVGVEDWAAEPVRAVRPSRWVYRDHALLRAAALLHDRDAVTLPGDIAPLVQAGYGDPTPGPESWRDAMHTAQEVETSKAASRKARAQDFLLDKPGRSNDTLDGWVRAGVGDAEEDPRGLAQVRDGAETLEVLVVQRDRGGGLLTPDWIERGAGQQIPLDQRVPTGLARTIAACALRLPLAISHPGVVDDVIAALERNRHTSFDQSPLLSGQLVLELDGDRRAEVRHGATAFRLTYDPRRGLLHESA